MNKRFLVALVITSVCFFKVANAQPGDPGGDPDVPIIGIEILIGAGGVWVSKRRGRTERKKINNVACSFD
jgi:hypothetical protein